MKKAAKKRPDLFRRLNAPYRVVFIDDESLEEVASFSLTKSKMYMLSSSLFIIIILITVIILLFTPLKYYIPGYGTDQSRIEVIRMKHNVDSLNQLVQAQQEMTKNLKQVITGNFQGPKDTAMLDMDRVKREDMNSILPSAQSIRQQAIPAGEKRKRPN